MDTAEESRMLYEKFGAVAKAIKSPFSRGVFDYLNQQENYRSRKEISDALNMPLTAVGQALDKLSRAGLIGEQWRADGSYHWRTYILDKTGPAWSNLETLLSIISQVQGSPEN